MQLRFAQAGLSLFDLNQVHGYSYLATSSSPKDLN